MTTTNDDERLLGALGYEQELHRGLGAFSNFALSLSIICILAGGVTSFHLGLGSVGGAAIGIGWPVCCLFSLVVALTMGQVASAFPTAGGLYHWAAILGGRGWGWATAWFNLAGLVFVLAAINVGTYEFGLAALAWVSGESTEELVGDAKPLVQPLAVLAITFSQALVNHRGIRLTARLTDFSGYWILVVSLLIPLAVVVCAPALDFSRLWTFENFSGRPAGDAPIWPSQTSLFALFLLGLLLPGYTLTGFDASAHAAEETLQASTGVPRGIVRSVLVSGVFGWVMLCAVVAAAPDLGSAVDEKSGAFVSILQGVLPPWLAVSLIAGILVAQYLCGLAAVTSASRMVYAFARDGGVPVSGVFRQVHARYRTPVPAIWAVAVLAVGFTVYTPAYETLTAACVQMLYVSYVLPTTLGLFAYGRSWTTMGPWTLGAWYRPLAVVSVLGCGGLLWIGVQPPNEKTLVILAAFVVTLGVAWLGGVRGRFRGPPVRDQVTQGRSRNTL